MREEGLQVQVEAEGASGRGGGRPFEGAAATRPSPLIALRLLARAQEERSLAVKVGSTVLVRGEPVPLGVESFLLGTDAPYTF